MPRWLIVLGALTLLSPTTVVGCSCVNLTPEQQFAEAHTVFLARVTSAYEVKKGAPGGMQHRDRVRGKFEVQETFKGSPSKLRYVETGYGGSDCGVELLVGSVYLFYTNPAGETNRCDGSAFANLSNKDNLKFLEKLRALSKSPPNPSLQSGRK